jgi:hypothetical protein
MLGRFGAEHIGRSLQQLVLPVRDLVGMHIVHLRQLGQCPVASYGVQRHLRLEYR